MEDVLHAYYQGKFNKCLELILLLPETDDVVQNLLLENCKLMCESYVRLFENDPVKIFEMQELHHHYFEKVTSVGIISNSIPFQLRLNATFNFTFWLLFYNDEELGLPEEKEYLELINKGLLSVVGAHTHFMDISDGFEKVLKNLTCLKSLILNNDRKTVLLILELVVIVIVYVVKLRQTLVKNCLEIVTSFIEESFHMVKLATSQNDLLIEKSASLYFFKFSLSEIRTESSDVGVIDYLYLLESAFLFLLEDFKGSLKSLQRHTVSSFKSLWNYLVILNTYELEKWDMCSVFLGKVSSLVVHDNLKARLHIMQGKVHCVERQHKEALKEFENALLLSPKCPTIYYYLGQEYGKMGLIDLMVENFEKLIQVLQFEEIDENFRCNFETTLLDFIHPFDEITETEALYALAVSFGLNENFKNATECFEKILKCPGSCFLDRKRRIIQLPSQLTILHEASIINLLHGNLVRAEQISLDAADRYVAQTLPERHDNQMMLLCKDIEWLQRVIHYELLETDFQPRDISNESFFSEDLLLFFPQNVIALLTLSEIQGIQEIEENKSTLSTVFSIFSKYLASMHKKKNLDADEEHVSTLVKALAGKTCVRIAAIQIKECYDSDVEKMFKRALSCNKGDKDALYNYYKFLLKIGKERVAFKLWNTFFKEKSIIEINSLQSFSLRYFLTDKITKRELDKIQKEIEVANTKFS